ncbi:hypothetical protein SLEP1_g52514 [Rubroshorea leprosula]|uniref:Uncharacterized protein n=1 Tax=Rubroshorea leprosula TaxID=152421 RepID=A0AAV5M7L7_9ROSI|nr:hypothetical protein SLEP1_g52514 [Rubroshorea leprosula]
MAFRIRVLITLSVLFAFLTLYYGPTGPNPKHQPPPPSHHLLLTYVKTED